MEVAASPSWGHNTAPARANLPQCSETQPGRPALQGKLSFGCGKGAPVVKEACGEAIVLAHGEHGDVLVQGGQVVAVEQVHGRRRL